VHSLRWQTGGDDTERSKHKTRQIRRTNENVYAIFKCRLKDVTLGVRYATYILRRYKRFPKDYNIEVPHPRTRTVIIGDNRRGDLKATLNYTATVGRQSISDEKHATFSFRRPRHGRKREIRARALRLLFLYSLTTTPLHGRRPLNVITNSVRWYTRRARCPFDCTAEINGDGGARE